MIDPDEERVMRVKDKYGFLPTSVLYFKKDAKLVDGFLGDQSLRLSVDNPKRNYARGVSEFNPSLADFVVRYWSKQGDLVVDPFMGWGTRLFTCLRLGRGYQGYEVVPETHADVFRMWLGWKGSVGVLSPNKIVSNADLWLSNGTTLTNTPDNTADLIFTCPPYHNREEYTTTPDQLSNIPNYPVFLDRMQDCAKNCHRTLKPGKYCVIVCADWRVFTHPDEPSELRMFSQDIIRLFNNAGFVTHDFIVHQLNTPSVVRAGKNERSDFVTRAHEYVLVFRKKHTTPPQ